MTTDVIMLVMMMDDDFGDDTDEHRHTHPPANDAGKDVAALFGRVTGQLGMASAHISLRQGTLGQTSGQSEKLQRKLQSCHRVCRNSRLSYSLEAISESPL